MTTISLTSLAARSISHTEIARADMSDIVDALRSDAIAHGDTDLADECAAVRDVIDGEDVDSYCDGQRTVDEARSTVMRALRAGAGSLDVEDDVVNGDVWEIWGTDEDGSEWRVHVALSR